MRSIVSLTSLAILAGQLFTQVNGVCRAVAYSGGGSKGAWEAGATYGLMHALDPADLAWDVVSGVSAGAINAGGVAMYDPKDGKAMSEWLVSLWSSLTTATVYKDWPMGFVDGLFNKSGFYDNTPLLEYLTGVLSSKGGKAKRQIVVSAVDVNTGQYVNLDETVPEKDYPTIVVASASVPFVFPNT